MLALKKGNIAVNEGRIREMEVEETIRLRSFENELAHLKTEIERLNNVIVDQKKSSNGEYYDLQDCNAKCIERIHNLEDQLSDFLKCKENDTTDKNATKENTFIGKNRIKVKTTHLYVITVRKPLITRKA